MKKTALRLFAILLGALTLGAALAGCGNASSNYSSDVYTGMADEAYYGDYDAAEYDYGSSSSASASSGAADLSNTNRKIIENYYYSVETTQFDDFVAAMEAAVKELGGYVESKDTYRSSTSSYASTSYNVKIPSEKNDVFAAFIDENANVLSNSVDTTDVTLSYIDTESRIKALRLEQESLEKLLEKAETVSDIIEVQERLSDVIYEIESYESQLRSMDNDIDFTSFSVSVREVSLETATAESSLWDKIGNSLSNTLEGMGEFFEELFIVLIGTAPVFIALGLAGLLVFFIVRASVRHKRKKRAKKAEQQETEQSTAQ